MDREKVISALDCRANDTDLYCPTCEYFRKNADDKIPFCDFRSILNDAIALLKEQEAVKPKSKVRHANAQIQHFCGNCNSMLHGKPKYCSECGKGVLW